MINFILMLTHADRTIDDALDYVDVAANTGLHYIGFKDVGATPTRQRAITRAAHDAGLASARHIQGGIDAWKKASGPLTH